MKITVEFANLNEFKQYMGVESPNLLAQASKETEDAPAPAEAVQEPQKAPEDPAPKKNTKKVEKTAPAEAEPSPESADASASEGPSTTGPARTATRSWPSWRGSRAGKGPQMPPCEAKHTASSACSSGVVTSNEGPWQLLFLVTIRTMGRG